MEGSTTKALAAAAPDEEGNKILLCQDGGMVAAATKWHGPDDVGTAIMQRETSVTESSTGSTPTSSPGASPPRPLTAGGGAYSSISSEEASLALSEEAGGVVDKFAEGREKEEQKEEGSVKVRVVVW